MSKNTYEVSKLINMFHEYRGYKNAVLRDWRLIRSLYRGDFWNVFKKHVKEYTMTPDWNYFEYTIQAYLNSIYSGAFIGTVTPRYEQDTESVQALNAFIAYNWNKWGMKNKFLTIGEHGELYNMGIVRVDWNQKKFGVSIKTLSPDEVYIDPSVDDYREGDAIFIERSVNIYTLQKRCKGNKVIEDYIKKHDRFFIFIKFLFNASNLG